MVQAVKHGLVRERLCRREQASSCVHTEVACTRKTSRTPSPPASRRRWRKSLRRKGTLAPQFKFTIYNFEIPRNFGNYNRNFRPSKFPNFRPDLQISKGRSRLHKFRRASPSARLWWILSSKWQACEGREKKRRLILAVRVPGGICDEQT